MVIEVFYYPILGQSLIFWAGFLSFLFMFLAGYSAMNIKKGPKNMKDHVLFGKLAIAFGLLHFLMIMVKFI